MSGANRREQGQSAEHGSSRRNDEPRSRGADEEHSSSAPRAQAGLPAPLNIDQLGRYRIVREIAAGGMARVYLAVVDGLDKMVALKVIHPHLAQEESFVGMFLDEARIASSIAHRNVCSVFDFGECEGHFFIAMEYLAGQTLREINLRLKALARQGALEKEPGYAGYVASILAEACEGLHAAHETMGLDGEPLDVVHRDVSPHNLFVTYDGNVSVVDFGIARAANRLQHTATGILKGKFSYMAPEQVRQGEIDRRADIWSLGVCLWESLTHERLFQRASQAQTLMSVLTDPIRTPSQVKPELPGELDAIVMRALARDLNERYPTARELGRDLLAFCRRSQVAAGPLELELWMGKLFAEEITRKRRLANLALQRGIDELTHGGTGSAPRAFTHSGARVRASGPRLKSSLSSASPNPEGGARAAPSPFDPPESAHEARPTGPTRPSQWRELAMHAQSSRLWLAVVGGVALALAAQQVIPRGDTEQPPRPSTGQPMAVAPAASMPAAPPEPAVETRTPTTTARAEKQPEPHAEAAPTSRPLAAPALAASPRNANVPVRASRGRSGANARQGSVLGETSVDDPAHTRGDVYEPHLAASSGNEPREILREHKELPREQEAKSEPEVNPARSDAPRALTPSTSSVVASSAPTSAVPASTTPPPAPKLPLAATPSVAELNVEGSLGSGVITRMLTRSLGLIRDCYTQSARNAGRNDFSPLAVNLVIDETGSVSAANGAPHPLPDFSSCVVRSMRRLRSDIKPDVGTVRVRFNVMLRGM